MAPASLRYPASQFALLEAGHGWLPLASMVIMRGWSTQNSSRYEYCYCLKTCGSRTHLIPQQMQADMMFQEAIKQQWDLIVLPGGSVGAYTMRDCPDLIAMLAKQKVDGKLVGANGETPSIVLASIDGFLRNGATCFPLTALRNKMPRASDYDVVVHDKIVTSQGIGSALVFALMLVELLFDSECADKIAQSMLVDRTKYQYYPPSFNPIVRMRREEQFRSLVVQIEKLEMPCNVYMSGEEKDLPVHQTILRKQIQFFVAQQEDIDNFAPNRKNAISIGQVGIRCKHCAVIPSNKSTKGCVYFPKTLNAIYQAANNMSSSHFTGPHSCRHISPLLKAQLGELLVKKAYTGHGGKNYWAKMAGARGVCETEKGLRFHHGNF